MRFLRLPRAQDACREDSERVTPSLDWHTTYTMPEPKRALGDGAGHAEGLVAQMRFVESTLGVRIS